MGKETRANLIFILVLIPLLAPGAIALVRKSMETGSAPLAAPPITRTEYAYIDPWDRPTARQRVVPPKTLRFMQAQAEKRFTPADGAEVQPFEAVVSSRRTFEVVAAARTPDGAVRIAVAAWNPALTEAAAAAQWQLDGHALDYGGFETVALPEPVRQELVQLSYVRPPKALGWYDLVLEPAAAEPEAMANGDRGRHIAGDQWVVRVSFHDGDKQIDDACVVLLPEPLADR